MKTRYFSTFQLILLALFAALILVAKIAFKTPLPKPLAVYICHCDECRRQSSSAFGCSAIFPAFPLPKATRDGLSVYTYVSIPFSLSHFV